MTRKSKKCRPSLLEHYIIVDKPAGEGSYGIVYKAYKEDNPSVFFAVKKIKMNDKEKKQETMVENGGLPPKALREISLLKDLCHENVIHLLHAEHACFPSQRLYLVFEWVDYDLAYYMEKIASDNGMISSCQVRHLLHQLVKGIEYCHSMGIVHRDLKPQNLLVTQEGTLKIADFGMARAFCIPFRSYTHEVVTLAYRCPEILLGARVYGLGVDMWSVGVIFMQLVNMDLLWRGDSEIGQLFRIFKYLGTPDEMSWPGIGMLPDFQPVFPCWEKQPIENCIRKRNLCEDGLDLLEAFLTLNPAMRISARRACRHPYFFIHETAVLS